MDDLISRKALLTVPNVRKVTEFDETGEGITYLAVPVDAIEKAPAVDAEPVRHGEWGEPQIIGYDDTQLLFARPCSECGHLTDMYRPRFCPDCGDKMDGKEK